MRILIPVAAAAPTEKQMQALHESEHAACFACRPRKRGGLGLEFHLLKDASVQAHWSCPSSGQGYQDVVHGGLLATVLDSAMVHVLFAHGRVAKTGELNIRYRRPVETQAAMTITAKLVEACSPLYRLEARITQHGSLCAQAQGKFMLSTKPGHTQKTT